jgi:hypothetical protein
VRRLFVSTGEFGTLGTLDLFHTLALCRPHGPLVPHVQELKWDAGVASMFMLLFLHPSLRTLTHSISDSDNSRELAAVFNAIRRTVRGLRKFELYCYRPERVFRIPALGEMLLQQHDLHTVTIQCNIPLELDVLVHLGRLPALDTLGIVMSSQGRSEADTLDCVREEGTAFPALRHLNIHQLENDAQMQSGPLLRLTDLVETVGGRLEEFEFFGQDIPSATLHRLMVALSKLHSLRSVRFEMDPPAGLPLGSAPEYAVTFNTLAPLRERTNLVELQISSSHFALAPGDLAALSRTWKAIERFWFQQKAPRLVPYPVLGSQVVQAPGLDELAALLAHCPALRDLSMPLHIDPVHIESLPRPSAPHTALRIAFFAFAHVPPSHVQQLGAFLADLCPWASVKEHHELMRAPLVPEEVTQAVEEHFDDQRKIWRQVRHAQRECVRSIIRKRGAASGRPQPALSRIEQIAMLEQAAMESDDHDDHDEEGLDDGDEWEDEDEDDEDDDDEDDDDA